MVARGAPPAGYAPLAPPPFRLVFIRPQYPDEHGFTLCLNSLAVLSLSAARFPSLLCTSRLPECRCRVAAVSVGIDDLPDSIIQLIAQHAKFPARCARRRSHGCTAHASPSVVAIRCLTCSVKMHKV